MTSKPFVLCWRVMAIGAIAIVTLNVSYRLSKSNGEERRIATQDINKCSMSPEHKNERHLRLMSASLVRNAANQSSGHFLGTGSIPHFFSELSIHEARHLVHGAVTDTPFQCPTSERIGKAGDGGYHVCTQEPYKPKLNDCLVYSFGINNEWSFDEAINSRFGCEVHSFDPSMHKKDHMHKDNISFHDLGIWGSNFKNDRGWELKDLKTIVNDLKHTKRNIDYLKIDVEGAEWPLIEHIVQSGIHSQIKQMVIEIHTPRFVGDTMTVNDYGEIFNGMHELRNAGFKGYLYQTNNNCCGGFNVITTAEIAGKNLCCYELFFVNSKLGK